jgi:catechol 2,3-dioxygenase
MQLLVFMNNNIIIMKVPYKILSQTRIGHVHLKVADLKRALTFYCDLLSFEITTMYGEDAAFISAGGYHHHIGLNTWYSKEAGPALLHTAGLFHTAILYAERKELTAFTKELLMQNIHLQALQIMVFQKHCT